MKIYEEIIRRESIIRKIEKESKESKESKEIIKKKIKGKIRKNKEIIIKRKMRENIKGVKYMTSPELLYKLKLDYELQFITKITK